jgi:hypothetical protein
MIALKRWWVAVLILIAPFLIQVNAQGGNLLQDPGFEGPYVNRGRSTLNTPDAWKLWLADGPHNYEWQNRADKVTAFPHNNGPEVHGGANSLNLDGGYVTYTAAVYQQVSAPPNINLTGSAWARFKTCNLAPGAGNCGSAVESGAFVRVGIDPNGGIDPNSPSIVWSGNIQPHDNYQQAIVSATSGAGGTVTFFIYTTQAWPADLNRAWFDDASLGTGGAGGTAPGQPTVAPTARPVPTAFVAIVQPTRPDGSIIHIVQPGDTMTGISTAYGVAIDTIMQLNSLRSSRFIFVGQELLIKRAGGRSGVDLTGDLLSPEDLAGLNPNPGPTPIGMQAGPTPTLAG